MNELLIARGMPGGIIFLIVFGSILLLTIWSLIAGEFQKVAKQKGYHEKNKYFLITFFFGIVGMLLVIALPDKRARNDASSEVNDEKLPEL